MSDTGQGDGVMSRDRFRDTLQEVNHYCASAFNEVLDHDEMSAFNEVLDHDEALRARLASAEAERDNLRKLYDDLAAEIGVMHVDDGARAMAALGWKHGRSDAVNRAEARIAELEEALAPFADYGNALKNLPHPYDRVAEFEDDNGLWTLCVNDFVAARRALDGLGKGENNG